MITGVIRIMIITEHHLIAVHQLKTCNCFVVYCVIDSLVLPFRSTRLDEKPVAETEAGFALLSL